MQLLYSRRRLRSLKVLLITAISAAAQASPSTSGERQYAPCVVCHQPNGWGSLDGTIPNLAGQQKRYLEKQLAVFRSGARVDVQIVTAHATFDDQHTIATIADYLSRLEANPTPVEGSGEHLRLGQETYTHICAACHGVEGRGSPANRVPRIAGQHYPYLQLQIEAGAALHKDLAPPEMTSALRGMDAQQKNALADYISRLGQSEGLLDTNRHSVSK
jgi:cytochrome c553